MLVICLAALAMRRRSRSVPRDAPEHEQIVGLSHAHKTLKESGRCSVHLSRLDTSGRKCRSDKQHCEWRQRRTAKPADIPDSFNAATSLKSINVTRQE